MVSLRHLTLFWGALLPAAFAVPTTPQPKREVIPNKYIIALKEGITSEDFKAHVNWASGVHVRSPSKRSTAGVSHEYHIKNFNAYAGEFDEETIEQIKNNPDVAEVEQDQACYPVGGQPEVSKRALTTQEDSTWGLSTISHRNNESQSYIYDSSAGKGTFAYVIDSGVWETHEQFGGRAEIVYNAINDVMADDLGHGTHVAGTIAGSTYGVAKQTTIQSVKVFEDGGATNAIVIDAINWAANDIVSKNRQTKAAIHMSLSSAYSSIMNTAVQNAHDSGILVVVSAGNSNQDAGSFSPASSPDAITVGSVDQNWNRASDSDFGGAVDLFAPGVYVLSSWIGNDTAAGYLSGTSMAAPHVTGVALYLMALEDLSTPAEVISRIKDLYTTDKLTDIPEGTVNAILYNGNGT
ncbi:alkaline proteinase [Hypoxylon sp. FL1284]|nr:alkaline proteinase [Hypoxylon sp. FL1284]